MRRTTQRASTRRTPRTGRGVGPLCHPKQSQVWRDRGMGWFSYIHLRWRLKENQGVLEESITLYGSKSTYEDYENPSQRALWMLSYIQGPRVEAWLNAEVLKLKNMVDKLHFTDDDEEIWDTFESDFKHTFEDKSQKADGMLRLQNLSMATEKGLEEYISTFDAILTEIRWEHNQPGTVRLFKDRLDMWISRRMHLQDTWPDEDDLDGWEKAA